MDTLIQDIRFALRNLRKTPGFTLLAAITLALGIGVNTTMFSVVDGILIKPYPFREPENLVVLFETSARRNIDEGNPSYQNVLDWKREAKSFETIAMASGRSAVLTDGVGEPERLLSSPISWDMFPMLGKDPIIGRHIREDEDKPGAPGVVLLGHALWMRRYNGDPNVIGRVITINTKAHTVIGVMEPEFRFPARHDLWIPIQPVFHDVGRGSRGFMTWARLKSSVSGATADAELKGIAKNLAAAYPAANEDWSARVGSLSEEMTPDDVRLTLWAMFGAVTFVLLIACANVANLLLARATARQREVAIRAALGAGRWRIVRQLLTESVIVAVAGGVLGALLAVWGTDLIWLGIPPESDTPYYITWSVDASTLGYTLLISLFVGVVFGLAPALEATKGNLQESLKEGGRGSAGSKRHRLRNGLVVAEVALSLILLVGASLFVRSFLRANNASGGFDTAPIMTFRTYMPGDQYVGPSPKARRIEDVMRRIEALPGVVAAAASNLIPLSGGGSGNGVAIEGKPVDPGEERGIFWTGVTAHWLKTLNVAVSAGRDLTEREAAESSGVAVINQPMAEQFWGGEDPIGRRFRFPDDSAIGWVTVIGVVPFIQNDEIDDTERNAAAYLPYPYLATPNTGIVVRVAGGDPRAIMTQVRREVRNADPGMPVFDVYTMEAVRRVGFWQFKLFGWMFAVFGAIALLLAAVGVYGVLAYSVTQRTQEMGVRTALGARPADVLRLVVGEGVKLAGLGIGIGLLGAFGVTRFVASILYDTSPSDPLSYTAVALFLVGVAALASWLPARKATRVDPIIALRYE